MTKTIECGACGGTGIVSVMESVYPGEPHQAPTGTQECIECNGTGEIEEEIDEDDLILLDDEENDD